MIFKVSSKAFYPNLLPKVFYPKSPSNSPPKSPPYGVKLSSLTIAEDGLHVVLLGHPQHGQHRPQDGVEERHHPKHCGRKHGVVGAPHLEVPEAIGGALGSLRWGERGGSQPMAGVGLWGSLPTHPSHDLVIFKDPSNPPIP